jgi:Septin family protein
MVDPSSIMTDSARRAQSSVPSKTRSETTVSYRSPPDLVPDTSSMDDSDDEAEAPLTMSPAELRVIRRLSARSNVLPVIAHTDSLTDEKLLAVKNAVRTGLQEAGLDFGVFGPSKKKIGETIRKQVQIVTTNGHGNGHDGEIETELVEESEEEDEGEERQPRPVIKLRPSRHSTAARNLSRSRSRRDLSDAAGDARRPLSPDPTDRESVANVRFSAHIIAKTDLSNLMPFALIAPEASKRRLRPVSTDSQILSTAPSSPALPSEDGHAPSMDMTPPTPVSTHSTRNLAYLQGPPDDLKGVFIRKFRWGTVDVLDPNHCDFAALRTAVLSTHLKVRDPHFRAYLLSMVWLM